MRRSAALLLAAALALSALAGCSSVARSPTVPHINFTPSAKIRVVTGCGAKAEGCAGGGPATPKPTMSDPLDPKTGDAVRSVPDHAVLLITSEASGSQQVTGTVKTHQVFDTGQLAHGDTTTVVLSTPGVVTITLAATGQRVSLIVRPAPTTSTTD
jgi:hypothetical protein